MRNLKRILADWSIVILFIGFVAALGLLLGVTTAKGDEPFSWLEDPKPVKWEWSDADLPEYMRPYQRAIRTQAIYTLSGRPAIDSVSRTALEEKWRVPGGMEGIKGWKSQLYKWAPSERWQERLPVVNSFGFTQFELGWKLAYGDGAEFLDVLSNTDTGKVFEVRKAVKAKGQWKRFKVYVAAEHWPKGYEGPFLLDCNSCHSKSGAALYGGPMNGFGDSVLSDPIKELEGQ